MTDNQRIVAVFMTVMILIMLAVYATAPLRVARPEIFIMREAYVDTVRGPALVVDYMVGGVATGAVFYADESGLYDKWIAVLEREGKVRR